MTVGLTGGIAAGKSIVRQTLANAVGLAVFDADACVHRLLENEASVATAIRRELGESFLRPNGKPDRKALRELVFRDVAARRKLEAILHPLVRAEWSVRLEECRAKSIHFLADIPLLYETGAEDFFDSVVVVACSQEAQLDRLLARGIKAGTAQAMLASQLPIGQKVARANFVIWNDGSLVALGRQIKLVAN
ncbi:MAG: dephospho-CoA kinase, partial [Chthoniobacterales bacterium]